MRVSQAMDQLNEPPQPLFFVEGSETFLVRQFLRAVKRAAAPAGDDLGFNSAQFEEDTPPAAVLDELAAAPLLGGHKLVIYETKLFENQRRSGIDAAREQLLSYLDKPFDGTSLVVCAAQADGRLKLTKQFRKRAIHVQCDTPSGSELVRWIGQRVQALGGAITREAAGRMAQQVYGDLSLIDQELQKLVTFAGQRRKITAEDVQAAVAGSAEQSIFDLVDAVGQRQAIEAISLLRAMLRQGEPALRILAMVARQLRLIWQVQILTAQGKSQGAMRKQLGQHPFVIRKCSQQARFFQPGSLRRALRYTLDADLDIKRGRYDESLALERLVLRLQQL